MFCANCGAIVGSENSFCENCGAPVNFPSTYQYQQPLKKKSASKALAIGAVFVVIIMMIVALVLIAKPGLTAKTDSEIMNDVQKKADVVKQYNIEVYKMITEKRQTDVNNKRDIVYAFFKAKNEDIDCYFGLELIYTLYNNGWILDSIQNYNVNSWTVSPLKGVTREQADEVIGDKYNQFDYINSNEDLKNGICKYDYSTQNTYNFMTETDTIEVVFTFNKENADWTNTINVSNHNEVWNVGGTWTYAYHWDKAFSWQAFDINAKIDIDSFDGRYMKGSYSITNVNFDNWNFSKSGSIEVEKLPWTSEEMQKEGIVGNGIIETWSTMSSDWTGFYFDKDKGVLFYNPGDGEWHPMEHN